ncbi:hypothetical protein [Aliarcobacter skirrowii]|uniref:hypothetical protein n=1 Tax=Aliarcobacter skirrowii TaxID=28200 RepID=UPI0029A451D6|nr:hypothetical protein [Aliarcobacter skirrowii]MDX4038442.1 hypothetical protein [Aliarcobacter skirrowii]
MISPIQADKTYGVLHTESFFSFLGFAKKVGSDEIQKIDVFLDDKLIDTIEANEFIQKIDDMYDVESKAFTYNLPVQYIGKKAIISFKNHDSGEELLNSPYTLIDKNHEKFNEAKFLHSLSEPLSEELKNIYKPNSIGFLATDINLNDQDFVEYIKTLHKKFPELIIKPICFNQAEKDLIKLSFEKEIYSKFKILEPTHIQTLIPEINLFCENFTSEKQGFNHNLFIYLMKNCFNIYPYGFHSKAYNQTLELQEIGFFEKVFRSLNINFKLNTKINRASFKFFDLVSIAINNNQFAKVLLNLKNENNL